MNEKENVIVNNIVYAVKGGCGKTTFSIALATALDASSDRETAERESCIIDMDIQGTALKNLLFGKKTKLGKTVNLRGNKLADIYLNEKTSSITDIGKKYISKFSWHDSSVSSKTYGFDVVLASPNEMDKNEFRSVAGLNYSPTVQFSTFREGLKNMLSVKDLHSQRRIPYKYVIFDMPPNSDGYSDAVFDCLLNDKHLPDLEMVRNDKKTKYEYVNNLFIVQTLDLTQRDVSMDYLYNFLTTEHGIKIDNIYMVYNFLNITNGDSVYGKEEIKKEVVKIVSEIKGNTEIKIDRQYLEKLKFIGFKFSISYSNYCCKHDGICNKDINQEHRDETPGQEHFECPKGFCVYGCDWDENNLEDEFSLRFLTIKNGGGDESSSSDVALNEVATTEMKIEGKYKDYK